MGCTLGVRPVAAGSCFRPSPPQEGKGGGGAAPGEPLILIPIDQPVRPTPPQEGPFPCAPGEIAWRSELRGAIRDPRELCQRLGLPGELASRGGDFPLLVPASYLSRIRRGDPADPLLRQVLPDRAENDAVEGFSLDPVGDHAAALQPGVLQKYRGRVLLVVTGACAVHCRYCFRRNYPYATAAATPRAWEGALGQIAADPDIHEVILSGGDPLTLGDDLLAGLAGEIAQIGHVKRLRVHTRLPVVIPSRVTPELLGWLTGGRLRTVLVHHANHAQELDTEVGRAARELTAAGVVQLNQGVLLRGVNDSVEAQEQLCERLMELGIVPYYLHQLDRAAGTAHFEVPEGRGEHIIEQLRARLPGYMVPRLVQEVAGEPNKVVLA